MWWFFLPETSEKNVWHMPTDMPSFFTTLIVIRRFFITTFLPTSTFSLTSSLTSVKANIIYLHILLKVDSPNVTINMFKCLEVTNFIFHLPKTWLIISITVENMCTNIPKQKNRKPKNVLIKRQQILNDRDYLFLNLNFCQRFLR